MAAPFTKSGLTIVQDFASAAQAACGKALDFTVGSVFLALAEGTAAVADWLQKLYIFALLVSRLQTSGGVWVDSFCADYMPPVTGTTSPRLPAAPATGVVTFARSSPQSQVIIPVGTIVATFDGTQAFQVIVDATNSAYSATIIPVGGYVVAADVASIDLTVQAFNPGALGNVVSGSVTLIRSSLVGIDTVTNAAAFANGFDAESDDALKARFKLYILSLRAGTNEAIEYAVTSLQQGLQVVIHDNTLPDGSTSNGAFTLYVDDGSGAISSTLVSAASTAVNAVNSAGTRPNVLAATKLGVHVSMTITTASGYYHPSVVAAVANAVGAYIQALTIEQTLRYTMLEHIAYNASAGVTDVSSVLLSGSTADIVPAMGQTIKLDNTGVVVA